MNDAAHTERVLRFVFGAVGDFVVEGAQSLGAMARCCVIAGRGRKAEDLGKRMFLRSRVRHGGWLSRDRRLGEREVRFFAKREIERGRKALEERGVGVLLGLKVVDGDALEVGDDEVAGRFFFAPAAREGADVFHALRVRFAEIFARALVLGDEGARPEQVDVGPVAAELFHRLLERGDGAALDAEDVEEGVPKRLGLA